MQKVAFVLMGVFLNAYLCATLHGKILWPGSSNRLCIMKYYDN